MSNNQDNFQEKTKMKSFMRIALGTSIVFGFAAAASAQDDAAGTPLEGVTQEMKVATNSLAKKATDKRTQTPQEAAVAKLDLLIAELEKEKKSLGNDVSPNPKTPATSSTIRKGPGGMGDLHSAREQGNRWGDLPAHERDRILQSLTEGFPAHYQGILEAYYKRLAVEKKAESDEAATKEPKSEPKDGGSPTNAPAATKPLVPSKKAAQ
jgi:hypothetical protein